MFSDEQRGIKIGVSILLLVLLGWVYTDAVTHESSAYASALKDSAADVGGAVVFSMWEVTTIRDGGYFEISKSARPVRIYGDSEGLKVGDIVTIKGAFTPSGDGVRAGERIAHPWRKAKAALSLLAVLLFFGLSPKMFGWSNGRVVPRG